jgi:ferredoxin
MKGEAMPPEKRNISRRKFMAMGSAAAAAPLLFKLAGGTATARAEDCEIVYRISTDCIGCHFCFYECPASAIHWGDDKYIIDQDKCIQCGTCAEVCNVSAAHPEIRS